MSRLSIEIDPEQHRQIKTLATFSGMTIKEFILSKTLESSRPEMDTTEKLLSSPENRKRLMDALNEPRSKHIVFESVEDLERALGI